MTKKLVTTEEDFVLWKTMVINWMIKLGLHEWEYDFVHDALPDHSDAMVSFDSHGLVCTFTLNKIWEVEVTDKQLEITASHEVLELLLAKLSYLGETGFNKIPFNQESHSIIHRIQGVLYEQKS